ncbi:PDDEXK-like family protein [Erythrobacter sp. EC-HK427]|uniref:PDDEXK-like family protein n=1 Tax=Erythrobacter sp. EC-HK427 TaxID=2038396 RepID=UPI00125BCECB|nr:conserved hypothetical protein [Erythrobacter sp. EC-HK427]
MNQSRAMPSFGSVLRRLSHQYPILAAKRAGSELFGAPRLNAFSLFRPNEASLSRIIADIFDPRGTHGQDILFLNALLRRLDLPRVNVIEPITVRREMMTRDGRQIDLVIETPRLIVGIENKPWAAQQPDQLVDYLSALKGWSRGRSPVLIFLSNKEPETAKSEVRVVRLHSDDETALTQILADCRQEIRAARTQTHIAELVAYLKFEFGGEPMKADENVAYIQAVESEYERGIESKRALAMVMLSQTRLHKALIEEIAEEVLLKARGAFNDIEEEYDDCSLSEALGDKDNWWGFRRPSWPENCSVAISPGRTNYADVYFGIRAPDPRNKSVEKGEGCSSHPAISEAVREVEGGSSSGWWPWWKWAEPLSWNAESLATLVLESPTGLVADHPRIKDLIDRMLALAQAIDETLKNE